MKKEEALQALEGARRVCHGPLRAAVIEAISSVENEKDEIKRTATLEGLAQRCQRMTRSKAKFVAEVIRSVCESKGPKDPPSSKKDDKGKGKDGKSK
jgi:hypothetical protein